MNPIKNAKWFTLIALSLASVAIGLDMTVLNLALPTLSSVLHASTSDLEWFVDAYSLVLAAFLLPSGMLGDQIGRKKVLLVALVLFGLGSVLCAYSTSADMLIVARIILGLGAAALIPMSMAIIPVIFTDSERPKAIAMLMIGNMLAFPIGPILGGWLLTYAWWGWVFLINVPIVTLGLIAVVILLPDSKGTPRPIDILGILLSGTGMVGITYGVIKAGDSGWGSSSALVPLILGTLLLVVFILWQKKINHPLINLSLFRSRGFTWGALLATLVSFTMFGLLFVAPQYFQDIGGSSAFQSGLRLLPMVGGLLFTAPLADRMAKRIGNKMSVSLGFALFTVSMIIGTMTKIHSGVGLSILWLAISGAGLGFVMPLTMDAAIGELSVEQSGVGSALIMALRQVGSTIGVAILGSTLNSIYRQQLHLKGLPTAVADTIKNSATAGVSIAHKISSYSLLKSVEQAFVHGMDAMLWICAGIAMVGILLTAIYLPGLSVAQKGLKKSAGF